MSNSPHHPVFTALSRIGDVHLVGSRSMDARTWDTTMPPVWNEESDYDYYLGVEAREVDKWEKNRQWAIKALEDLGFVALPGSGGPYGIDHMTEGVWRLPEQEVFGIKYAHADVVLMSKEECDLRMRVWRAVVLQLGRKGGEMARMLKAEKGWGKFWWGVHTVCTVERHRARDAEAAKAKAAAMAGAK